MTKILILGGGFGGVRAALDLEKKLKGEAAITLVDKKSYQLFVPALYEVASAYGVKGDPFAVRLKKTICIPYSDIFENKKINFVQAEVSAIDLENKKVATRGGEILDYDYLVIALGGQAADFGIPGVKEYAFQFKELEDALLLNQKVEEFTKEVAAGRPSSDVEPRRVERQSQEGQRTPQRQGNIGRRLDGVGTGTIKLAVVGAGFTGIEVAAEFACCVKTLAKVCGIKGKCERVILLEAGPKILPAVSDSERKNVLKRLTKLGIEVMENAAAEEVGSDYIKLKNGKRLDTDLVIWTAGIRLPDLLKHTPGLPLTDPEKANGPQGFTGREKIKVNNSLEVEDLSGVFAVGDNTEFIDSKTGKPISALAYVAVDQGKIVAKNILRILKSKPLVSYNPFYSVWIAPVGGKYALAHLWGGFNVKGFWGWVTREAVDFRYMLSILPFKKAISLMWQEITLFTKND